MLRETSDGFVVAQKDLGSSLLFFAVFAVLLRSLGWALVAMDMQIDMTTPNGRLVAHSASGQVSHLRAVARGFGSAGTAAP